MTKTEHVFTALVINGEQLTAKQLASRYNIGNPYEAVRQVRLMGYPIYCNKHTNSKGVVTHKYRLGTPSRELIAAGYKALAARLV